MQWDREKPKDRQKLQDEQLREYVLYHVFPYSPFYRRRFDTAKTPAKGFGMAELARLEPTRWAEVEAEPGAFLLRPTERAIARFGERRLVMAVTKAKLRGKVGHLNRALIDPAYKPIHWHFDGDVPVGYSAEDLERLGEAGGRMLEVAGVTHDDVLVNVSAPGPSLAYWQIVEGARHAGLSTLHAGPGVDHDRLVGAAPTVLAGAAHDLRRIVSGLGGEGRTLPGLRTLLLVGGLLDAGATGDLRMAGRAVGEADLEVATAWAPRGVQAMWGRCRGGEAFHTYPDYEFVEALDDGEVAWTSLAWHGTTFLRLRTGVHGKVDDGPCPNCGRVGPRFVPGPAAASDGAPPLVEFARPQQAASEQAPAEPVKLLDPARLAVLDGHASVAAWAAEYRRVDGGEELIVFVAPAGVDRLGPLFRELDTDLAATQYVVERPEQVRMRRERDGAVLDKR